jgi:hypothetical protein
MASTFCEGAMSDGRLKRAEWTHGVGVDFVVGAVGLGAAVLADDAVDELLGLVDAARADSDDLVDDVVHVRLRTD